MRVSAAHLVRGGAAAGVAAAFFLVYGASKLDLCRNSLQVYENFQHAQQLLSYNTPQATVCVCAARHSAPEKL
jgi:hypothetical protein